MLQIFLIKVQIWLQVFWKKKRKRNLTIFFKKHKNGATKSLFLFLVFHFLRKFRAKQCC